MYLLLSWQLHAVSEGKKSFLALHSRKKHSYKLLELRMAAIVARVLAVVLVTLSPKVSTVAAVASGQAEVVVIGRSYAEYTLSPKP